MKERLKIDRLDSNLGDERIKRGVDYALVVKYGEVHVLSHEVFKERIIEEAAKLNLTLHSFHTYH